EPRSRPLDGGDRHAGAHRRGEGPRVRFQVVSHLGPGHEAVRVGTAVGPPREPALPARGQKVERIPPLAPPALSDAPPFEDHVLDAADPEMPAHREPGLSAADDDHVGTLHRQIPARGGPAGGGRPDATEGAHPAFTETVTGTPLVSTSYTAERFRDCSTI